MNINPNEKLHLIKSDAYNADDDNNLAVQEFGDGLGEHPASPI